MIRTFQKIFPLSESLKSLGLALSAGSALTEAGKFQISTMRGGGSSLRKCVHYVYRWSRLGRIWTYLEFRMIPVDYLLSLLADRLQIIRGDSMEMLTVRSRSSKQRNLQYNENSQTTSLLPFLGLAL